MEFEFGGHIKTSIEQLLKEVEEIQRRQKTFKLLMERVMAEQAELRPRQEAQSQEWQEFGWRWSAYSAPWKTQMQQLKGFTR